MDIIKQIQHAIQHQLPGEDAHIPMSPLKRKKSSEAYKLASNVKKSSVALILFSKNEELYSILIQRPLYKGNHSGQVCLPGGKYDPEDKDLLDTSLRESYEETGIPRDHLKFLGELTPVYIPVSNYYVAPYVFYINKVPEVFPDEREVQEIFFFKIKEILNKENTKRTTISISENKVLPDIPYFHIKNKIVWGATALILNEFKEICLYCGLSNT